MHTLVLIVALVIAGVMAWNLYRRFGSDALGNINDRRRPLSRLVSRGEFVDSGRRLAVALAVTKSTLFYENSGLNASIDLQWIREVEYDTQLTGGGSAAGGKVLRLRSSSRIFEFVVPEDVIGRWHLALPPRRAAQAGGGA